jgi:CHAT domain-containing protein
MTHRSIFISPVLLLTLSWPICEAQESDSPAAPTEISLGSDSGAIDETSASQDLPVVFDDDFASEKLAKYKVDGVVEHEASRLSLREGATLLYQSAPANWLSLTLHIAPAAEQRNSSADLNRSIAFSFDARENDSIRVEIYFQRPNAIESRTVRVYQKSGSQTESEERLVREFINVEGDTPSSITISQRYGLIRIDGVDQQPLFAYARGYDAPIHRFSLKAIDGDLPVDRLTYRAQPVAKTELTEEQQDTLAATKKENQQIGGLFQAGRYAEALAIAEANHKVFKQILGDDSLEVATCLNDMAVLSENMDDFDKALVLYQQAIDLRSNLLGSWHPDVAQTLNNLATANINVGKYRVAKPLLEHSLEITRTVVGENVSDYSAALSNYGQLLAKQGDFASSISAMRRAMKIDAGLFGEDHFIYAMDIANLASTYADSGDNKTAFKLYRQSAGILKSTLGAKHPYYLSTLNSTGASLIDLGDLAQAEAILIGAKQAIEESVGKDTQVYGNCVSCLGALYDARGDYEKSLVLLQETLEMRRKLYGETHPSISLTLNNLSGTLERLGRTDEAREAQNESLRMSEEGVGRNHSSTCTSLLNLAILNYRSGNLSTAEQQLNDLIDRLEESSNVRSMLFCRAQESLAQVYVKQGRGDEALHLFQESQDALLRIAADLLPGLSGAQARSWVANTTPGPDRLLSTMEQFGVGDDDLAYRSVWKSRNLISRLQLRAKDLASYSSDEQSVLQQLKDTQILLANLVSAAAQGEQGDKIQQRISQVALQKEDLERRLGELDRVSERQLLIRDASIEDLASVLPEGVAVVQYLLRDSWNAGESERALETDTTARDVSLRLDRFVPVYDAFVIRAGANTNALSIDWFRLGDSKRIDRAIADWRVRMAEPSEANDGRALGSTSVKLATTDPQIAVAAEQELRQLLWEPIESKLSGIHTIVIIPDGQLHRLAWNALPGTDSGSYLVEDFALCIASSGQHLLAQLSPHASPVSDSLLVAGGIDYDSALEPEPERRVSEGVLVEQPKSQQVESPKRLWSPLEGARREAVEVGKIWADRGQFVELQGSEASEQSLLIKLPKARFAHLATHGYFEQDGEVYDLDLRSRSMFAIGDAGVGGLPTSSAIAVRNPLLMSGFVVAGANKLPHVDSLGLPVSGDGVLTGEEIVGLDLRAIELVTLSACESGLGEVAAGEGVFGLQSAFHDAGAQSVIASLWKVDDDATRALMAEFYTNLWERKLSKVDSLRQAQLAMLRDYDPKEGVLKRGLGAKSAAIGDRVKPVDQSAASPAQRLHPRFWAAFQLSGDWR